jgi:hypothetical protein
MLGKQNKAPATQPDPVGGATQAVGQLAAALLAAERESTEARLAFDRQMREHVADSLKAAPSQEPQRAAVAKVESLRRLLAEAREHLAHQTREAEETGRLDAIRATGGRVAGLITSAEAKLVAFEAAIATVRRAETELFDALFNKQTGLRQPIAIPDSQRDADFARHRLRRKAIAIAAKAGSRLDAQFETDGEIHLGPLERHFRVAGN